MNGFVCRHLKARQLILNYISKHEFGNMKTNFNLIIQIRITARSGLETDPIFGVLDFLQQFDIVDPKIRDNAFML